MFPQGLFQRRQGFHFTSYDARGTLPGQSDHDVVDVLYFSVSAPPFILTAPLAAGLQPNRKGFGEIFGGVGLGIPCIEVQNIVAASGLWLVPLGIRHVIRPKGVLPTSPCVQTESVIDRVSGFMPQNSHTFGLRGPLHLQHLCAFQFHQAGVSKIKRDCKTRDAVWRKPFL